MATIEELEVRVSVLEKNDKQMKDDIKKITENTDLMVEILDGSRTAFKLVITLAKVIKFLGGLSIAMAAIWALWVTYKTGQLPTQH